MRLISPYSAAMSVPPAELERLTEDTARFWRGWVGHSTYRGRWQEMVARSAITLKLCLLVTFGRGCHPP